MDPKTVIFFGMSGSGKGTQAKLLEELLKERSEREVLYLETGRRFREFAKGHSYTQQKVQKIMDEGGLLPAFLPIHVWGGFFVEHFTGNEHIILDGLARRAPESPVLDGAIRFYERMPADVVILNLSRDTARERLKLRGRDDDVDEEDITHRLDWYEENAVPAINFFRNAGDYHIHDIDGGKSVEDVHRDIREALSLL